MQTCNVPRFRHEVKCSLCQNYSVIEQMTNEACTHCGKRAGIMILKKPRFKQRKYERMPYGKFKGTSIEYLIKNERWYIDYIMLKTDDTDLINSIASYL